MSLTVPTAGLSGGRAAQLQFETPQTGAAISQFGDAVKGFGDRIEKQRLDLESAQLQLGMTRDLNQLRLKYEAMGDPAAIDAGWAKDSAALKDSYLNGQTDQGAPRVDPKIRAQFDLQFSDLAERHAFALGTRNLAIRQSQTIATGIEYANEAAKQAATSDAGTRDEIYVQNDTRVDREVAQGLKTPEQGAKDKIAFRAQGDANAAFQMLQADPHGLLDHLAVGEMKNLSAEDRISYKARAENEIDRRAKAAAQDAETAAKEQVASWKADVRDGIAVVEKGGLWGNAAMLDNPAVAAALPDEVAQARGAIALQGEAKNVNRLTLPELQAERDALAAQPANKAWQTEKRAYLEARIAEVEKATSTDPVGFWQTSMPDALPALDMSNPQAAAKSLAGRVARADHLTETGHLPRGAYLSAAELAALKPMIADTTDATTRLGWASALAAGGADHAIPLAKAAGATPAFQQALTILSDGADPAIVMPMLRGEQKLAANLATAPAAKDQQALFNELTGDVFASDPATASRVLAGSGAIYADDVGTISPDDIKNGMYADGPARTRLMNSIQLAMGASPDANGELTIGGVQDIRGHKLALPRGVAAAETERTLTAIGLQLSGFSDTSEINTMRLTIAPPSGATPPIDTGQKTQYGRKLWQAPDGSFYSERTITAQAADGKWYNVPTVTPDGRILDPNVMTRVVEEDGWKPFDPITNAPLQAFGSVQRAVSEAVKRSEGMDVPKGPDIYRGLKAASLVPGQYPDLGANGADPAHMWNNLRIEPAGTIGQDAYLLVKTTDRGIDRIVTDPQGHEYYFSLSKLNGSVTR